MQAYFIGGSQDQVKRIVEEHPPHSWIAVKPLNRPSIEEIHRRERSINEIVSSQQELYYMHTLRTPAGKTIAIYIFDDTRR